MADIIPLDQVEDDVTPRAATSSFIPLDQVDDDISQPAPSPIYDSYRSGVAGMANMLVGPLYKDAVADTIAPIIPNMWQGVKNIPGALYDTAKSIPSGISNLAHLPGDVSDAAIDAANLGRSKLFGSEFTPQGTDYSRIDRTLKGVGNMATSTAGYLVGGPAGAAAATTGYDKVLQFLGAAPETSPEEDLAMLAQNTGTFGGMAVGGDIIAKALKKTPEAARTEANALDRKSIGTRQSDYGTKSTTRTIETPEGGVETFTKQKLDSLIEEKALPKTRNPEVLSKAVNDKMSSLNDKVGTTISSFDEANAAAMAKGSGKRVYVEFPTSEAILNKGGVLADEIPAYQARLRTIQEGLETYGNNKLAFLQEQKKAFGDAWKADDSVASKFNRAVYTDLKKSIEAYAPEVELLNKEISKYMPAKAIIDRTLTAKENATFIDKLQSATWTTGGVGAPTIAGATLSGPIGAAVGAGLGLGARYLGTPSGKASLARGLRNIAGIADPLSKAAPVIGPGLAAGASVSRQIDPQKNTPQEQQYGQKQELQERRTSPKSTTATPTSKAKQFTSTDPVDIAVEEAIRMKDGEAPLPQADDFTKLLKAVSLQESGGNPDAVSDAGAIGLHQIMPATAKDIAKELGVTKYDLKDPETNTIFAAHYLKKLLSMFGNDPELALAAYHSGPGRVKNLLKLHDGKTLSAIRPYLGPVGKQYASGVLSKLKKIDKYGSVKT